MANTKSESGFVVLGNWSRTLCILLTYSVMLIDLECCSPSTIPVVTNSQPIVEEDRPPTNGVEVVLRWTRYDCTQPPCQTQPIPSGWGIRWAMWVECGEEMRPETVVENALANESRWTAPWPTQQCGENRVRAVYINVFPNPFRCTAQYGCTRQNMPRSDALVACVVRCFDVN